MKKKIRSKTKIKTYLKCLGLLTSPTCPGKSIKAGLEQGFNYTRFPPPPFPSPLQISCVWLWRSVESARYCSSYKWFHSSSSTKDTTSILKAGGAPFTVGRVCSPSSVMFLSFIFLQATFFRITCKSQKLVRANSSRQINNPPWEEISIICWTSNKSCCVLDCFWPMLLSDKVMVNKNMGPFTYLGSTKHRKSFGRE